MFIASGVCFYAHLEQILQVSRNRFNNLIPASLDADLPDQPLTLAVPHSPAVFSIVLYTIYGWPSAAAAPTLDEILTAVDALHLYGVPLSTCVKPDTPLWSLLQQCAPLRPLDIYAMAGQYELELLAVSVSSQLLSVDLSVLPDEVAVKMGARYLYRLANLQTKRMTNLRQLLLQPPNIHVPSSTCSVALQKRNLTAAWAEASMGLAWIAKPGKYYTVYHSIDRSLHHRRSAYERHKTCDRTH